MRTSVGRHFFQTLAQIRLMGNLVFSLGSVRGAVWGRRVAFCLLRSRAAAERLLISGLQGEQG